MSNWENFALLFEKDATITYSVVSTLAMPRNSNYEAELSCRIAAGAFGSCDPVFILLLVNDRRYFWSRIETVSRPQITMNG